MASETKIEIDACVRAFVDRELGLFVDGAVRQAPSSRRLDDPSTGDVLTTVPDADTADVDRAVTNARETFNQRVWSGLRPADRGRILLRLADVIEAHGEELPQRETLNQGKSINIARAIEVGATVEYMR